MKKNITKLLSLLLTLVLLLGMLPLSAMAEETGAELSGENPGTEGFPSSEDREEEEKTGEPEASLLSGDGAENKSADGGSCGATESDAVNWSLAEDGTLTISGTGAMQAFTKSSIPLPPRLCP